MQKVGTFTQMVWKNSTEFAMSLYKEKHVIYVVGVYFPAGNIEDEYVDNVLEPSADTNNKSPFVNIPTIPSLPILPGAV